MRKTFAVAAVMLASLGTAVSAQDGADDPVVVELFTSQGCTACPPADALVGELSARGDVIALSLHVDYWDYIGWADTFAQPEFTERQYGYGHAEGSTVVYTPQIIIGGQDRVVGYRPMNVADLVQAHRDTEYPVEISVTQTGESFRVEAQTRMPPPRPEMVVQLVTYSPHQQVQIERGERAGSTSDHYNVVTSWQVVSEWDGNSAFSATVEPAADVPHVVIVQQTGHGPILGAAWLR